MTRRKLISAEVLFIGGVTRTYICQKELQEGGKESLITNLQDGRLLVLDDRKVLGVVYGNVEIEEPGQEPIVEMPLEEEQNE